MQLAASVRPQTQRHLHLHAKPGSSTSTMSPQEVIEATWSPKELGQPGRHPSGQLAGETHSRHPKTSAPLVWEPEIELYHSILGDNQTRLWGALPPESYLSW